MSNNPTAYEQYQQKQTLAFILWAVFATTFILGIINLQYQSPDSILALFGLSIFCMLLLVLNARGQTFAAAFMLSAAILLVIHVNLYDGDGILDPGVLAYPIFILIGTLFFGKRAAPIFTLAAMGSAAWIVYLEIHGMVHPTIRSARYGDLIPILILFTVAASIIWVIIGNAEKNLESIKKSELELMKTYDLTLEAWAKMLEFHDRETEGHSRRAVELSIEFARALNCSEEEIAHLRRGALLHDIGKMALPDHVLQKPGPLDEGEKEIIKEHPRLAKEVLMNIPFLEQALDVIYSHHERWDGQGYPLGLKGEEIPLLARVFTIVDQWDALRAERVYRPAWSREKTVAYFQENKGRIFDPHLTDVFLQIV